MVDGQRVPITRAIRQCGGGQLALDNYRLFQKASLVEKTVWSKVMQG